MPSMSSQAATARGWSATVLSTIEMTKICDSANTTRWRNWSRPVMACVQKESSTSACVAEEVAALALITASAASQNARCDTAGSANCSSIHAA